MIHEQAIVDPSAKIADDVEIGPWTRIGANVEIGSGCKIASHAVIEGPTVMGRDNHVFQFASIGASPQDKKYEGADTRLEIGNGNVFRENTTIHRGTEVGGSVTKIGDDNLFMAYVHIAHDCIVGNNTIFANNASLAGHVIVEDFVVMSGFSGISQFCKMGKHSFAAMGSMISKDVPPYVRVSGYFAKPFGLNAVGLQRRGFSDETVTALRRAYKIIYRMGLPVKEVIPKLHILREDCGEVQDFIYFLEHSERGIVR